MRCQEVTISDYQDRPMIKAYHSKHLPKSREFFAHHHTECEFSVVLKGSGVFKTSESKYLFSEGDVFLFGSNEPHCVTDIYTEIDVLNIHFEPKLLWEHSENIELLSLFNARSKNFRNLFSDCDGILKRGILAIEQEITQRKACVLINTKYLLFSLLIHIMRTYDCTDQTKAYTPNHGTTESLKRSIQYIDEHLAEPITLEMLSGIAHLTPAYYSSLFKKYNGISPWKYITIKRVEMAIDLLRTSNKTKLDIAQQCGFPSSSNFYKAFLAITGKKPGDFAKAEKTHKQ